MSANDNTAQGRSSCGKTFGRRFQSIDIHDVLLKDGFLLDYEQRLLQKHHQIYASCASARSDVISGDEFSLSVRQCHNIERARSF